MTLDPDDNNYYYVNTWISDPLFSDDDAIPIRRSQGQYTRIVSFGCLVINMKAVTHVEQV